MKAVTSHRTPKWLLFVSLRVVAWLPHELSRKQSHEISFFDHNPGANAAYLLPCGVCLPRSQGPASLLRTRKDSGRNADDAEPSADRTDKTDCKTMHPGIWMAFGDLDGEDFWRNKASIEHVEFVKAPQGGESSASFAEEKRYVASDGTEVCRERFRWRLPPHSSSDPRT